MERRVIIAGGGTGGHLYPAMNLAEALEEVCEGMVEVLLIGAERGVEAQVLPRRGVPHRLLPLQPIFRSRPWRNWRLVPSAARSSLEIHRVFSSFTPTLVVGTGGYAAGPVVAWALATGRRTAIQEQNSYPGLVTRWLAPFVDQIHLGYEEALAHLHPGPATTVRVHGNPIRWPAATPDAEATRGALGLGEGPVLLVAGGSQGAAPLNRALLDAFRAVGEGRLPPLPAGVQVLWATGRAHHDAVAGEIGEIGDVVVRAVPYIDEMERALSIASLAVCRAGALALSELCAWGVPAVLVPLPHAAADHQRRNARALEKVGAAIVVEESSLGDSPAALWEPVIGLLHDPERLARMAGAARSRGQPGAARAIAEDLVELMEAA